MHICYYDFCLQRMMDCLVLLIRLLFKEVEIGWAKCIYYLGGKGLLNQLN